MKYLVTGGAGFIGSNLVRYLLAERPEAEVVTLDALTYAGHLANLEGVLDDPRHRFVHGDICDAEAARAAMKGVGMVFHLAAESHVDRSIVEDHPFVRTNVMGTAVLLSVALDLGVGRFVQVSTDEVYGELPWRDPEKKGGGDGAEPSSGPGRATGEYFTEDTPLAPRSPYSATKAAADHLAAAYHATHGLDVVITRCSNNYGPYQYPEKLIPLMIRRAIAGKSLPVYGDGLNVRDWIHVSDHCGALVLAGEEGRSGRVYNFGGDAERTNMSVVRDVLRLLERDEALIEFVADRPGHDRRYAIDYSRARDELGWSPNVVFAEGLADTVDWYRANGAWVAEVTSE